MIPFQTPEFNPADADLIKRVCAAPEPNMGFHIGGSVHYLDCERWMILGTQGLLPGQVILAYPLPVAEWGEDHHRAMSRFQDVWSEEADRLGLIKAYGERLEESRQIQLASALAPDRRAKKPRKPPIPRPHELPGACALPGLEEWTGFGRLG